MANGHYHPYNTDSRISEIDPVMQEFCSGMMPMLFDDLIYPFRQMQLDFNEFVLMKMLLFFRDGKSFMIFKNNQCFSEFFLSDEALQIVRETRDKYSKVLFNYVSKKCGGDLMQAINRYTELLNLVCF